MIKIKTFCFLLMIAGISTAIARVPAPLQHQTIAIIGATIHTVTNGVITEGTLVFDEGRITAVGKNIVIPDDAHIIDAKGKHIYPGFIHGHSILGLMEVVRTTESTDIQELGDINPNIRSHVAYHSASTHLSVAAVHGVTTVVPTPRGSLIAGKISAMTTDGWTWEEMIIRKNIGMVMYWPSMNNSKQYIENLNKIQDAFDKARRYKQAGNAKNQPGVPHHPFDSRWEALIPVLNGDMPVFIVANDARQIQAAISWAQDENINIVLTGSRDMGLIADLPAQKNIPVMLTGVISGPAQQWQGFDEAYQIPRILYEAGVMFCIAGDAGAASTYRLPHHAAAAVAFGLPEEEALKAITINAAKILGIDDILGSIETGKNATFFVSNGNALEIKTKTELVFINGRKINMTDKHKYLYDMYLEKHIQKNIAN